MATISKKVKESFANAETLAELKNVYVGAMHKYVAGAKREELGDLYAKYFDEVKTWCKTRDGKKYEKSTDETAESFTGAINGLMAIEGVDCEMVGSWLWVIDEVEGAQKDNYKTIKSLGFRFAPNKKQWYIAPKNAKRSKKHYTYEEIKAMHEDDEA